MAPRSRCLCHPLRHPGHPAGWSSGPSEPHQPHKPTLGCGKGPHHYNLDPTAGYEPSRYLTGHKSNSTVYQQVKNCQVPKSTQQELVSALENK